MLVLSSSNSPICASLFAFWLLQKLIEFYDYVFVAAIFSPFIRLPMESHWRSRGDTSFGCYYQIFQFNLKTHDGAHEREGDEFFLFVKKKVFQGFIWRIFSGFKRISLEDNFFAIFFFSPTILTVALVFVVWCFVRKVQCVPSSKKREYDNDNDREIFNFIREFSARRLIFWPFQSVLFSFLRWWNLSNFFPFGNPSNHHLGHFCDL